MHWLTVFFGWPDGGVWSNLLASAMTAIGLWFRAKAKLGKVLAAHRAATAAELAAHRQDVAEQLAAHHQAVLAAVTEKEAT